MSIFKALGKLAGGLVNSTVGKLPIVGHDFQHIGNALTGKEPFLKGLVGGGAPLLLGAGSFGLGPAAGLMGKLGGMLGGKLGGSLGTSGFGTNLLHTAGAGLGALGKLNPGQLAALGGAVAGQIGANKQRKANQRTLNAETDLRNQLMSRVLNGGAAKTYDFTPEGT